MRIGRKEKGRDNWEMRNKEVRNKSYTWKEIIGMRIREVII